MTCLKIILPVVSLVHRIGWPSFYAEKCAERRMRRTFVVAHTKAHLYLFMANFRTSVAFIPLVHNMIEARWHKIILRSMPMQREQRAHTRNV